MMTIGWNQDALREIARQKAYRKKRMEIIKQKNEFREEQKKCHIIFTDGDECEFTGSRVFQKLREIDKLSRRMLVTSVMS